MNKINASNRITLLGTGTSAGVPLLGCACTVCTSTDPKNKRLRASAWVTYQGLHFLIDTSPDLRQQALTHQLLRVDAVLYTHPHSDHITGIDELRSYNFLQKKRIPVYGHDWTIHEIKTRFPYLFESSNEIKGGGIAQIDLNTFTLNALGPTDLRFATPDLGSKADTACVQALQLFHGKDQVAGFRFGSMAYLTDCNLIPEPTLRALQNLDVLVLDCLRHSIHDTHLNLDQALHYTHLIRAKKTIFTHMGHEFDYNKREPKLAESVVYGYDGLVIAFD